MIAQALAPLSLTAGGLLLGFLIIILTLANLVVNLRRKPPIESEFATKIELLELTREIGSKIDQLGVKMQLRPGRERWRDVRRGHWR